MDPTLNEKLITTKDAGEISGYTSDYLSRLVRSGKIIGKRVGRSWVIDTESLTRFLDRQDTHNTDRARSLANARAEEYRTHRSFLHRATKKLTESLSFSLDAAADIGHGVSHMSDMSERNLVKSSFRSQALALSVALFVVVSGAFAARASALPHIAGDVAATLSDIAFGFDAAFGDIPARVALRIDAVKDDAARISSRVAAMNAVMTADIASSLLAEPNLSSLRMALDDGRRVSRVASVPTHAVLSDAPIVTADDVRTFVRGAYAMIISPAYAVDVFANAYAHSGERAYAAIGASFDAYNSLIETAGTKTLTLAATARDTLANAPEFVARTNLALGTTIIEVTHAAIRADIAVVYGLAAAAPESARATVALIGGAGASLADATAELPRLTSSLFLRATAVPARVAPALAQAAFDAEYAALMPVVALSGQATEGYLAVVHETGREAYALVAGGSSLARATGATLAAAPSMIKDAYLGALGATALALSQPIHAIVSVPQVAAVVNATLHALSPIERVALATYETIHTFFVEAHRALTSLFGSFSNIAFAPRQIVPTTPPTLVATTTTRIVTVNNYTYPTYTTIARGVSTDVMNESLVQLRANILSTVAGMIQPVSQQVATNSNTIQYVNMIQKLDGLTVSNGIFTGGIFDSGIRVAATDGNFTNLTAGTTNLGATTIASISSSGITSYGQVIAPYFTATSTTATSTFAGRFAVGTSTPFGDGLFTLGTSTPLLFVSSNTGRIGIGTTTPDAMLGIVQTSNGTPFISAYRATDTLSSGDFITYKSAAGTTLFRVDNSGNLLAGGIVNSGSQTITSVSTPQFRVQYDSANEITTAVSSTGTTTIGIIGSAPSLSFTPSVNSVDMFKFTNAASTAILSIDTTNGRVGIGTTTPAWNLNVAGTRPSFALSDTSAGANLKHWLFSSLGGGLYIGTTTDAYATSTPSAFYISNAGRIGIGTVAPGTTFHINGTDGLVIPTGTTAQRPGTLVTGTVRYNSETSQFEGYGSTSWGSLGGVIDVDQDTKITAEDSAGADNDQLKFFTFGSERMRIDSNGNVGIGSTTPTYKLTVEGSSSLGNRAIAGYFTATTTTASSFPYASTTQLSAYGSLVVGGTSTSTIAGDYGASGIRGALTVYGNTTTGAASSLTLQRGSTNGDNTLTFNDQTGSPLLKLYSDANTGNARLVGYQSNLTLGTSAGGTALSIDTSSNINTTANIIPTANQTYDLGSTAVYWRNSYINNLVVNNLSSASTSIAGTNSTSFSINSNNPTSDTQDMSLIFYRGAGAPSNAVLSWNSTLKRFEFNQNAYFANATASTGSTTVRIAAVTSQTGALTSWLDSSGNVLSAVTASGNLGIGTSTPNNKLDIYNTSKAAIGFSGASGPTYKWTLGEDMADAGKFKISSSTALGTSDRFVIDGSGLVGLGTSSPSVALDIASAKSGINIWANTTSLYKKATVGYSDAVAADVFTISTNAPVGGTYQDIQIIPNNGTGNTGLYLNTSGQAGLGYTSFGDISIGTALLVNGRLGIGTTTPGSKLAVVANGRATGDLRYGLRIVNSDEANSQATGIAFSGNSTNKWIIGTDINHDNSNNFYIATSSGPGASKAFVLNSEGSLTLADTGAAPAAPTNKLYSLAGALWWNSTQLTSGTAVNYWSHSAGITYTTTNSDNVGVGTTTPFAKLSIHANNGETNTTLFAIASSTASATTTLFTISNTGTVSSNAIIPNGPYTTNLATFDLGATGSRWNALWAGTLNVGTSTFSIKSDANSNLGIFTAASGGGTQALTVTSAGNVGIGTASPVSKLSVSGIDSYTDGISIGLNSSRYNLITSLDGVSAAGNGLQFQVSDGGTGTRTTVMTLKGDGVVGIGTTNPGSYKLNVNGTLNAATSVSINGGASGVYGGSGITLSGNVGAVSENIVYYTNAVITPSSTQSGVRISDIATVATTIWSVGSITTSAKEISFINGNGEVGNITTNGTATAFNTSSDERLKLDQGVATSTDVLKNLVIHDFLWRAHPGTGTDVGVFAQEAVNVKPSAVSVGGDEWLSPTELENPWSVDYSKFVPDLIVGWQGHQSQLTVLQAQIDNILNGTSTSTITNIAVLNATTTATDQLCLSGDCRTAWPVMPSLSGYVSTSTLASTLAGYALLTDLSGLARLSDIPNISGLVSTSTLASALDSQLTAYSLLLASSTSSIASLDSRLTTLESAFANFPSSTSTPFTLPNLLALDIPGLCVTGDTRLRRRRRTAAGGYDYDEVAIKDVQAGDEIASLDEATGAIIWSRVKALAFMGVKQTYRITTEDGRQIRTTANHPYLTECGWKKVQQLSVGQEIAVAQAGQSVKPRVGIFIDSSNLYHAAKKAGWTVDLLKLKKLFASVSNLAFMHYHVAVPVESDSTHENAVRYLDKIRQWVTIFSKPLKYLVNDEGSIMKKGDVDVELTLDVVKSLSELDIAIVMSGDSDYRALDTFARGSGVPLIFMGYKANMAWELRLGSHLFVEHIRAWIERGNENPDLSAGAALVESIITKAISESRGMNRAVDNAEMNKSDQMIGLVPPADGNFLTDSIPSTGSSPEIDSDNASRADAERHAWYHGEAALSQGATERITWARIASIEAVALEEVYDIEVEGTHNFIGNGIVAHNTYLGSISNDFVSTSTLATTLAGYASLSSLSSLVSLEVASSTANIPSASLSGTVTGSMVPDTHNAYDLGSNSVRFANVYATNLHAGDLTFTETTSAVSGNTFAVGDVVTLYVNSTSGSTHTVPIDFRTAINTTSYGANNVYFNTSGKFGIGIASTTALRGKLDVEGAITAGADSRFLTLANSSSPAALPYSLYIPGGSGDLTISSNDNSTGSTINASYPSWQLGLNGEADSFTIARAPAAAGITATNFFKVASSGNVGIGSSTPSQLLSVGGSALFSGSITATNLTATGTVAFSGAAAFSSTATTTFGGPIGSASGNFTIGSAGTTNNILLNPYGGNVGIGTTSPAYKLTVNSSNATDNLFQISTTTSQNIFTVSNAGRIGIGTTNNSTLGGVLLVSSPNRLYNFGNGSVQIAAFSNDAAAIDKGGRIDFGGDVGGGAGANVFGSIAGRKENGTDTNYAGYLQFTTTASNSGITEAMRITSTGNVGIGSTTPSAKLVVNGDAIIGASAAPTLSIGNRADDAGGYLNFLASNAQTNWQIAASGYTGSALSIVPSTAGGGSTFTTPALTIRSTGLVMIGYTGMEASISVGSNAATGLSVINGNSVADPEQGYQIFAGYTGALHAINEGGGIGFAASNDPTSQVTMIAGIKGLRETATVDNHTGYLQFLTSNSAGTAAERMRITSAGDIVMAATNSSGGNTGLCWDGAGSSTWGGCTSLGALKTNIQDLPIGLDALRQLRPVQFEWKSNLGVQDLGFIAEEVAAVNPLLAEYNGPGGALSGVKYNTMTSLLTKAVQELDVRTSFIANAATSTVLTVDVAGNVGIGTTTPNHTLTVAGDVGAIGFVNTSTRAAKTDIVYATASSTSDMLDQLVNLKVATYRYTIEDSSDPLRLGFIAEEAQTVAPEILSKDGKGVDLYKLATFNLAATQALAAKFDAMNTHLTSLEDRITALENGSISTASGSPLALSTTSLASAFEGLGVLIKNGIAQFNTLVFRQLVASKDADGTSSAGSVSILTGNTVAQVNNSLVLPSTKVFVTFNSQITGSWWVSDKLAGSFRVVLSEAQTADVSFDYFLVQTEGQLATSTPSSNLEVKPPSGSDTTPPIITLLGDNPIRLSVGGTFVEPGITVSDNVDGAISTYVAYVNGIEQADPASVIDTSAQTTYIITYSATDARGNGATATRSAIIGSDAAPTSSDASSTPASSDTTAPVVTLVGEAAIQLAVGDTFTDPGATATDDVDGALTPVVTGAVDTATEGSYTLTYTATDAAGNSANVSRLVSVAASSSTTATSTPASGS